MSIYVAQNVEYRWNDQTSFSFFELANDGDIELCNATPFWGSIDNFEIVILYSDDVIGTFATESVTLGPNTSKVLYGDFRSSTFTTTLHNLMSIDFVLDGGSFRVDPNEFTIIEKIDTIFIGVIPYSTITQFDVIDFDQRMRQESLSCN